VSAAPVRRGVADMNPAPDNYRDTSPELNYLLLQITSGVELRVRRACAPWRSGYESCSR